MKNKIIALILVLALMLPFEAAFAKVTEDSVPNLLQALDIIPSAEGVKDETITRGEFAILAAKLVTINNYKNLADSCKFVDVKEDDEFYHEVNLLQQMGIIHGENDAEFRPNDPIELNDACKILIHIMGYQHFAVNGNYLVVADQRGLLSGINVDGNTFSHKLALKLIYNVLEADISDYNSIDGMSSNDFNEIFMTKRLGIYKIKAIVTDDSVISLTGESKIKDGYIVAGGDLFKNETGRNDLLGYTIEGFYKKDIETEENVMVYAFVKESENIVVTLTGDDVESYANHTYTYYPTPERDETEELYVDPNYKLIYNGRLFKAEDAHPSFNLTIEQMMNPAVGQVRLTNTDNDGDYEIVSVLDLKSYIISSIDYDNFKFYGKAGVTPGTVDLSAAKDSLNIKSPNGDYITDFTKVLADDVVSVGFSADGKHAEIIISNNKGTGYIQSADNESYIIGDVTYDFSPEYVTYIATADEPTPGMETDYYLTYENKIIYASKAGETGSIYARLIGFKGDFNDFDPHLSLKLYLENNSYDYYELANTVLVDGVRYKNNIQGIYNYLTVENNFTATGEYYGIILVKFNANDEVIFIDTPYKESAGNPKTATEGDNTLHIMKYGEKAVARYSNVNLSFQGKWLADVNAKFIVVADNATSPEKDTLMASITSSTASSLNNQLAEMIAFSTKANSITADAVVRVIESSKPDTTGNIKWQIVLKIKDAINEKGEPVKKITVTDGKVIKDYLTESVNSLICQCGSVHCDRTPLEVGVGDIIKIALTDNVILDGGAFIAYDYSEDQQWAYSSEKRHLETAGVPDKQTGYASRYTWYTVLSGYLNRLDFEAAEWIIDYLPFKSSDEYRDSVIVEGPFENHPYITTMRDCYTVEVDVAKGTIRPKLTSEIKQYDDGLGVIKKYFILMYNGAPYCVFSYK